VCPVLLVIVIAILGCGMYWFKVYADSVEDDSEGMVDPGTRQPYGQWVWTIVRGKSGD